MSEREDDRIGDEATRWFVLLQDPAASERQRRACRAWLAADPRHAAAWREVQRLWAGLDPLAGMAAPAPGRRAVLRGGLAALTGGALFLAGAALVRWGTPGAEAAVRTALNERRSLTLADGTAVELNGDSALTPQPGGAILYRGEAFFTAAAPFRVEALDGVVASGGGAFNVRLAGEEILATLVEGSLQVGRNGLEPVGLKPGESAGYGPLGPLAPRPAALERALAWRQGRLIFEDTPLVEVLAELQRYLPARLLLADAAAGQLRLTAVFDLERLEAALDTLGSVLPLRVERIGSFAVLIESAA